MWKAAFDNVHVGYSVTFDAPVLPRSEPPPAELGELCHALHWFGLTAGSRRAPEAPLRMPFFGGRGLLTIDATELRTSVALRRWDEIYFLPLLLESVVGAFVGEDLHRRAVASTMSHAAVIAVNDEDARAIVERHLDRGPRRESGNATYRFSDCMAPEDGVDGLVTLATCPEAPSMFRIGVTSIFRSDMTPRCVLQLSERHVKQCCEWLGFHPPNW